MRLLPLAEALLRVLLYVVDLLVKLDELLALLACLLLYGTRNLIDVLHDLAHVVDIGLALVHDLIQPVVLLLDLDVLILLLLHLLLTLLNHLQVLVHEAEAAVKFITFLDALVLLLTGKRTTDIVSGHGGVLDLLAVDLRSQLLKSIVVVLL